MNRVLWLLLFLLALTSLGVGILWERSVEFDGTTYTESEYGFGQQPHCWGCIAVRNPEFRPGRGQGGRRGASQESLHDREDGSAGRGGRQHRGGRDS